MTVFEKSITQRRLGRRMALPHEHLARWVDFSLQSPRMQRIVQRIEVVAEPISQLQHPRYLRKECFLGVAAYFEHLPIFHRVDAQRPGPPAAQGISLVLLLLLLRVLRGQHEVEAAEDVERDEEHHNHLRRREVGLEDLRHVQALLAHRGCGAGA